MFFSEPLFSHAQSEEGQVVEGVGPWDSQLRGPASDPKTAREEKVQAGIHGSN